MPRGGHNKNTLESILARTEKNERGCWNWLGSKDGAGYGTVGYLGKTYRTHRIVYILSKGEISQGLKCCHTCDNKACCNPDHIFLGTDKENLDDAFIKGVRIYQGRPRGAFKTICVNGHPYVEGSYYTTPKGHKVCKECRNRSNIKHKEKKIKLLTNFKEKENVNN